MLHRKYCRMTEIMKKGLFLTVCALIALAGITALGLSQNKSVTSQPGDTPAKPDFVWEYKPKIKEVSDTAIEKPGVPNEILGVRPGISYDEAVKTLEKQGFEVSGRTSESPFQTISNLQTLKVLDKRVLIKIPEKFSTRSFFFRGSDGEYESVELYGTGANGGFKVRTINRSFSAPQGKAFSEDDIKRQLTAKYGKPYFIEDGKPCWVFFRSSDPNSSSGCSVTLPVWHDTLRVYYTKDGSVTVGYKIELSGHREEESDSTPKIPDDVALNEIQSMVADSNRAAVPKL
jgi:hypothetical protein